MSLALTTSYLPSIGGGFHHCSSDRGGGFCAYADITLAIKVCRRACGNQLQEPSLGPPATPKFVFSPHIIEEGSEAQREGSPRITQPGLGSNPDLTLLCVVCDKREMLQPSAMAGAGEKHVYQQYKKGIPTKSEGR